MFIDFKKPGSLEMSFNLCNLQNKTHHNFILINCGKLVNGGLKLSVLRLD